MGRQGLGGAGAAGRSMQRSQSGAASASFEALAGLLSCELLEEEGEAVVEGFSLYISRLEKSVVGGLAGFGELGSSIPTLSSRDCDWARSQSAGWLEGSVDWWFGELHRR